ncbi:hypothetical protein J1614_004993 [Plenodomus biglobosus]|nr:hypothetical protein J1614_004993 [Plenodomus biglobosus]
MAPKKSGFVAVNSGGDGTGTGTGTGNGNNNDIPTDGNTNTRHLLTPPPKPQKFTWEGANDMKLLLLTQGRYVKPDEYEMLAGAFGDDTSTGSIRNRVSKLRVQQRTLYEELGWELPDGGGAAHSARKNGGAAAATPKKMGSRKRGAGGAGAGAGGEGEGEGEGEGTPKKARRVKSGGGGGGGDVDGGEGVVKEEVVKEEKEVDEV